VGERPPGKRRQRVARLSWGVGGGIGLLAVVAVVALLTIPGRSLSGQTAAGHPPALGSARAGGGLSQPVAAVRQSARGAAGLTPAGLATIRRLIAAQRPVYCGGPHGREVALTFDDGPGVYTHLALRKLRAAHDRATFFVVGKSIAAWPGYLRAESRLAALGDHTMTHRDLDLLPAATVSAEIGDTKAIVERATHQPVLLFRPPYGAHDAQVDRIVRRLGLLEVMWSVDSADSLGANYLGIIRNVEQGLHPGAIIEMHENRGQTIRALTTLLPVLRRRHWRTVSVLQLLVDDPPSAGALRRGEAACGPQRARGPLAHGGE
jgi:peptidoglycan/xylan/chitin deacetylase (PgdA/CDA1 family)